MLSALKCPFCFSRDIVRNGKDPRTKAQKLTCKTCHKHFQQRYRNRAYLPATKRRLDTLTQQGHSIRETARILRVSPTTVWTTKRTLDQTYRRHLTQPYPIPRSVTHVIKWSGGKDSSALLVWALEHLPPEHTKFIFCDTGWEAPITYRFIEEVNRRLLDGKLIVLRSDKYAGLVDLAAKRKRWPSTKARFCTEELKVIPSIRWVLGQQEDLAIYQGIRAEESLARRRMQQQDEYFREQIAYSEDPYMLKEGQWVRRRTPLFQRKVMAWLEHHSATVERPLFHWRKADVLTLCRRHGVLNPLYDLGFDRVGCFPCVMENKQGIRALAQHFPERIDELDAIEQELGRNFFPWSKVPDRQCEKPYIRDVVRWAEAEGKEAPTGPLTCLSHFTQCE